MPHVTAILGSEVGIQYQGVKDSSSLTSSYPVIGVMIGQFRRGRLDKPMTITRQNIKAKLGYDPTNPDYIAVQDALDSGVPSVQVLRVLQTTGKFCQDFSSWYGTIYLSYSELEDELPSEQEAALILALFKSMTLQVNGKTYRVSDLIRYVKQANGDPNLYTVSFEDFSMTLAEGENFIGYSNQTNSHFSVCANQPFFHVVPPM